MTSLLKGVVQRGTGGAAKVLGRPVAGKTGTTNDSRDTWFIGFTPDIVVGTYVGFDAPKSLGEKETGGRVAIQGFIKFMQQAADEIPVKDFRAPPGIREVPINRQSGTPLFAGEGGADAKSIVMESFLTGGPIFKPANELAEELKEKPVTLDATDAGDDSIDRSGLPPDEAGKFTPPGAGEMAPYQRPDDPQGFDPPRQQWRRRGDGGIVLGGPSQKQ